MLETARWITYPYMGIFRGGIRVKPATESVPVTKMHKNTAKINGNPTTTPYIFS